MASSSQRECFSRDGISLVCSDPASGDGRIFTLCMDRKENVCNPTMVSLLSDALDIVETAMHPKALVVTGRGKFFSNGLDLKFLTENDEEHRHAVIESLWRFLARLLVMDCRTVAAINGHGFGAGLFIALACDYRVMRTGRGYLCWPELNLGMRLAKGFAELSRCKMSPATLREGVLTGKRYGSRDAIRAGIVDYECPLEQLKKRATEIAHQGLAENLELANFDPKAFRQMKIELYTDAYRALSLGMAADTPQSRL